ncbi:helix-turn-helix domain-containing protein [Mycobacterium sp. Dal123C01]|uniref:helix-turn-helix domain-containing protein n=1 Tax=Mycobacterium sp. Dal123C01 TaxID=3457577 RepID=UPI00403E8DA2
MTVVPRADGPSSIIATAFDLLDQVATLEPARLVDLAKATGIPHPTVHRLLGQLIEAGAVRREGTRYRLGASLLELGSRVTPEHRLRVVARRPMAELAAITGAGVGLSASIGGETVFLDTVEPRIPLVVAMPEPGSPVPPRTSSARAHIEIPRPAPILDAGGVLPNLSCVTVTIPLSGGQVAAMTALITGKRPPVALVAATRAAGAQVARKLRTPSSLRAPIHGKSSLSRQ